MTPIDERPSDDAGSEGLDGRALTRKQFVGTAVGAAVAGSALLGGAARAATYRTAATARAAKGKVVIGAFVDGGLVAFKDKIIPLFQRETGIKVEFLQDDYSTFFEKAFQDGVTKAGQFDVYVMDDPWMPQYASAPVLQNLSKLGFTADPDYMKPFLDLGWWPPKSGPRLPQFRNATPQLYALPFVGDMQSLTYRKDAFAHSPSTWNELVTVGRAKMKPPQTYGYVFRGVKGNPIAASWFPVFRSQGGKIFDNNWKVLFNDAAGKRATEFFVHTLKSIAPPGVVEYDSDQEGGAILGGKALSIVQYSGNAIKSDDPKQSKVAGKLTFGTVPRGPGGSIAQIGIFISGISVSAPNQANAVAFQKWFVTKKAQIALARAGSLPVKRSAFLDAQAAKHNRLQKTILAQLNAGAEARPRTPDWAKVEDILGTELNKALSAGTVGSHLDNAAAQVTDYLKKNGYYK
jgi:multiple sugar transport system substrate-binding protein